VQPVIPVVDIDRNAFECTSWL